MTVQHFKKLDDIPGIERFSDILPVFATQEYSNYLNETVNLSTSWFCSIVNTDIQFIIPFAVKNKFFFTKGQFLTATIYLDNDINVETEREFLNSIVGIIKQEKLCDWIEQPPNWAIFNSYPDGAVFAQFGSYKINLLGKTIDELFISIQTKDRSDIKKAIKEAVEVKRGFEFLNDALSLIAATSEKANISIPSDEELNYLKDNINVFVSYYQNIPQSSAIFFSNKFAWYNMYAGSKDKPFRGSNSLLYWSAIKFAREENVLFFDFVGARINPEVGSKQERIQRFKEHFGVELFKGFIWKMPISKYKYYTYCYLRKILFAIKQEKLKGDIIDQELKRK